MAFSLLPTIGLGTGANTDTGDPIRSGGSKINNVIGQVNNLKTEYIDCRDFTGLDNTGTSGSDGAINAALAAGAGNTIAGTLYPLEVFLPAGLYLINNPITNANFNDSISMRGAGGWGAPQSGANFGAKTVIKTNYIDKPAIALNVCKRGVFRDFGIIGQNTAPFSVSYPFDDASSYLSSGVRNNRYSPYCAIAIDPQVNPNPGGSSANQYPGLTYTSSGDGSAILVFDAIEIWYFAVGVAHSLSGFGGTADSIEYRNIYITLCDTAYAFGETQSRNVRIDRGSITSCRTGLDGITYGNQIGCPTEMNSANLGNLYRIFQFDDSIGTFDMVRCYAESIRTIGTWGKGQTSSRAPLTIIGGEYDFKASGWAKLPPFALETYAPTAIKGAVLTVDGSGTAVDVLNFIGAGGTVALEQCSIGGTATVNVPPFIGITQDAHYGTTRLDDCLIFNYVGISGSFLAGNHLPRVGALATYLQGGRFCALYQSESVSAGQQTLQYQPGLGSPTSAAIAVTSLAGTGSTGAWSAVTFNCSSTTLQVGDILFWLVIKQGISALQYLVPALKVTSYTAGVATCSLIFDPLEYDTVANYQTSYGNYIFIAVREWAPGVSLTCTTDSTVNLSAISPTTILLQGDWVAGAGIPAGTRIVSASGATAVMSQAATASATGVNLYFGRLMVPTLTALF